MSTPIQKLFDLTGKTALVTGGSRGLGLQIAEALGEAGAQHPAHARARPPTWRRPPRTCRPRASTRAGSPPTRATRHEIRKVVRRGDAAPGPDRHPRQQRRRHLGRAGRGLSARGLGQGDEPEHPQHLPDEPGDRQGQHDPAPPGPHHQHRVDRRPGRLARRPVHRLRHQQGRGGQLHAHAGRRVGRLRHHRQRARAGLLPEQDDQGRARRASAPTSWPRTRRCAHRRRRRPEGRGAAVRLGRRQAHHRADPGRRRRRQRRARRRLQAGTAKGLGAGHEVPGPHPVRRAARLRAAALRGRRGRDRARRCATS